jgi:hypothetical protein
MSGVADAVPTVVRCPGCGGCTRCVTEHSGVERCPRCTTPLMLSFDRLDVENTVRERLYGGARNGVVDSTRRG